jgi:hypothetical protein
LWLTRHNNRMIARPNIVMPIDLCASIADRTPSSARSGQIQASATFVTMPIATSQWSVIATFV